ncbi:MAG: rhodanese-like domain-containing protein [Candidatus Acidiferrales bacterium]
MIPRNLKRITSLAVLFAVAAALLLVSRVSLRAATDPWTSSQTVQPADLLKELGDSKSAPAIVFVGFNRLYTAGHIKGAQNHGMAGSEAGLQELKAWASSLPRSTKLVIYCGCCPMDRCPNLRPAFTALHDLGFTKLRVLLLPTDFAVDWADKGYPYDRGQ